MKAVIVALLLALSPLVAVAADAVLAEGSFHDTIPGHSGSGTASLVRTAEGLVLHLADFSVTPGPDLEVWLVDRSAVSEASQVTGSRHASLGMLSSPQGDQSYAVPEAAAEFATVVIWCKSFAVLFSAADLKAPG